MLSTTFVEGFRLTPDGGYALSSVSGDGFRAHPVAGGSPILLTRGFVSTDPFDTPGYAVTENTRRVFFVVGGVLRVASITGGVSVELATAQGSEIPTPAVDGKRVVYRTDQDVENVYELYASWLDFGPAEHAPPTETKSATH